MRGNSPKCCVKAHLIFVHFVYWVKISVFKERTFLLSIFAMKVKQSLLHYKSKLIMTTNITIIMINTIKCWYNKRKSQARLFMKAQLSKIMYNFKSSLSTRQSEVLFCVPFLEQRLSLLRRLPSWIRLWAMLLLLMMPC